MKACLAKGASHESLNPKSPRATESRKPAMVVRAKPIPMTAAHRRRTATTPMPMIERGDRLEQEEGPMVGMER